MPKVLYATVQITLSDDQFEEARQKVDFKPAWDQLLFHLKEVGLEYTTKLDTTETRARAATAGNGTGKRGRKPKEKAQEQAQADT